MGTIIKQLVMVALVVVTIDAQAQNLAPTLRYFCMFSHYASPEGVMKAKDFKLEFVLETASGKGMMIGNQGFSKVIVVNGPYAITFLEALGTGVVQSTTITNEGYKAVHSRHSVLGGVGLIPTQYYGECEVLEGKSPLQSK